MKTLCGYAFDCPIHGIEIQRFCWRAHGSKEHRTRWFKYEMVRTGGVSEEEYAKMREDELIEYRQEFGIGSL